MTEVKHFKYEANVNISPQNPDSAEVTDIIFMTPAKIKYKLGDTVQERIVSVDFVNRQIYCENQPFFLSEAIFRHLDNLNNLPENFYEAPPDVQRQAAEIRAESGVVNG